MAEEEYGVQIFEAKAVEIIVLRTELVPRLGATLARIYWTPVSGGILELSTASRGGRQSVVYTETRYETDCLLRLYTCRKRFMLISSNLDETGSRNVYLGNAKVLVTLVCETDIDEIHSGV